ncbi:hypothetical protein VNI00_016171 [Paramarasmius palmivorus]|uniref:Uncharacterized protein n=1 Tax=Paramarasmius palmivorus TaxID=297713 RepID=A0AAW0BEU6_9AGAR
MAASLDVVAMCQKGPKFAANLREWGRDFIADRKALPIPKYKGHHAAIENEDLANDIALHLQSLGKYIKAMDIVDYVARKEVRQRHGIKKGIKVRTAELWLRRMGYRWKLLGSARFLHPRRTPVP